MWVTGTCSSHLWSVVVGSLLRSAFLSLLVLDTKADLSNGVLLGSAVWLRLYSALLLTAAWKTSRTPGGRRRDGGLVLHVLNRANVCALRPLCSSSPSFFFFFCVIFPLLSLKNCPEQQQLRMFSPVVLMRNRCATFQNCSTF